MSQALLSPDAARAGLRAGPKGAHASRTIMLSELTSTLASVPQGAAAAAHGVAIIEENCLGKATITTRRATWQRLRELYGLDPRIPLFRALRRAWDTDAEARPILALLAALARDPLLRASAPVVLDLQPGAELVRTALLATLRDSTGERFNDAVLDKVARNVSSSWAQSGHLVGRMRKIRRTVQATPGAVAFACWLGAMEGLSGEALLRSTWARVLDQPAPLLIPFVLQAKQLGLLQARVGGGVVDIDVRRLDELEP